VAIAGALFAVIIAFLMPPRYESQTQLMPPDTQSQSGVAMAAALAGQGGGFGAIAGDLLGVKSPGAVFVGILYSRTIEDRLVARFNLKKVYGTNIDETVRRKLAEHTAATEDRKSGILSIRVSDRDPKRAAALANAYVEELDRLVSQLATSSARREREFLEQRLQAVQIELEQAEKDFSQFASKNGAIDIGEQGKAIVGAAAQLEGERIAGESEVQGLRQIYTENNVRVRAAEARVSELKRQLEKLSGSGEGTSGSDVAATDSSYPNLRKLPLLGVSYADLFRRTKVEETVYETLTKEYELAKVQEAKEIPTVRVLDPANIPQVKAFPPRKFITGLGMIAGFGLGVTWIIGQARWHKIAPDNPGKILTLEVVTAARAWIPFASRNGSGGTADSRRWHAKEPSEHLWPKT